jgi:FkbM family methyltransferase
MSFKTQIGLLKSKFIYDYKPFNAFRLKRFYKQFVSSGDLCFDIGAHTGNRTKTLLALQCKVVAVEPSSLFANHLKKRFSNNSNFILEQKAISDSKGVAQLHISSVYPTVSTLSKNWQGTVNTVLKKEVYDAVEEVEVITLQNIIAKHGEPDFCKIDVEGFEVNVLKGLQTPLNSLSFEFYSGNKENAFLCIDLLMQLGNYEFNWSLSESLRLQESTWMNANFMKFKLEGLAIVNSGDIYARLIK